MHTCPGWITRNREFFPSKVRVHIGLTSDLGSPSHLLTTCPAVVHPSIKCNPILLQCTYHIQIPVLCFPSWAPMEEEEEETAAAPGNHKWWRKKELRERADKRSGEMGCVLLCGGCWGMLTIQSERGEPSPRERASERWTESGPERRYK